MARVSVEQTALVDLRYQKLGRLIKESRYDALGRMVLIWNQCQEQETYFLTEDDILDIFPDKPNFTEAMIGADLAERIENGPIRIKGTEGRIEWLHKARANGKYGILGKGFGVKGGRPKQNPQTGDINNPQTASRLNPPPSPTPAIIITPPTPPSKEGAVEKTVENFKKKLNRKQQKEFDGIMHAMTGASASDKDEAIKRFYERI